MSIGAAPSAHAAAGDLDAAFDLDGRLTTDFGAGESARAVVVQPDGKLVAGGPTTAGFALARYNPDGSLDTSFGGDGKVTTATGSALKALALQADGRIVAAGGSALARYNPDGSLDGSFSQDGLLTQTTPAASDIRAVAIRPGDGTIVVAGSYSPAPGSSGFMVVRYDAGGLLDTTWAETGIVTIDFGGSASASGVAVQPDGRIVVVGSDDPPGALGSDIVLLRLLGDTADHHLNDTSFGGDGYKTTDFGAEDRGEGLVLQPDGKIVVVGVAAGGPSLGNFALARYTPGGELDTTFSGDGKQTIDFGGSDDKGADIALGQDGKLVASGSRALGASADMALARVMPGGALDTSFAGDGRQTIDFGGGYDNGYGVALAPGGKVISAGDTDNALVAPDFALARLQADPPAPPRRCADGIDNDGDAKIDFPADPGCSSAADDDETGPPAPFDAQAAGRAAEAARLRGLRGCLRRVRRHARREIAAAKGLSGAARSRARRHIKRHRRKLRHRCLRRWGRTPGRVSALRAEAISGKRVMLSFNSAGSDGDRPPAARRYLIKLSRRPINTARAFSRAAALCKGSCRLPDVALGAPVALPVTRLRPRTTYYFAVAARDNVSGRVGPRSRAVAVRTR